MDKIIERNWNNDPLSYPVVFGHKKKKNNVEPLNPHLEVSVHLFMDDARHFGKDWAVAHFFRMEEHFKEMGRKDPEPDCVVEWVRKVERDEYDFDNAVYSVPPVDEPLILTQRFDKKKYPRYDNYFAFNVDRVKDIPIDDYIEIVISPDELPEWIKVYGDDVEVIEP